MNRKIVAVLLLSVFCFAAGAQEAKTTPTDAAAGPKTDSVKSMSLNGATGLYTVPSGYLGWEGDTKVGIDAGGYYNFFSDNGIGKAAVSLFGWAEVSGAVDFQPRVDNTNNIDGIVGAKVRLPVKVTAVSLGGNFQFLVNRNEVTPAGQVYAAATYAGEFFTWPAETTMALGYTFHKNNVDDIDFGMGFDLELFPDALGGVVHWLIDFSNFSYSAQPLGDDARHRGCMNTGLRLNFSAIPALSFFKLAADIAFLDIFDGDRTVALGMTLGVPIK